MLPSCGCSEGGCSASTLCVHCLHANTCAQEQARRRIEVGLARGKAVIPSLETQARALGLKSNEELQRFQTGDSDGVDESSDSSSSCSSTIPILKKRSKKKYSENSIIENSLLEVLWRRAAPAAQRPLAGEPKARPDAFRQIRYSIPINIFRSW